MRAARVLAPQRARSVSFGRAAKVWFPSVRALLVHLTVAHHRAEGRALRQTERARGEGVGLVAYPAEGDTHHGFSEV